jgi:hypothetical protein
VRSSATRNASAGDRATRSELLMLCDAASCRSVSSEAARAFVGRVKINSCAAGKSVAAISSNSLSRIAPKTSVMGTRTNSSK